MKNLRSLIVILALVVLAASWVLARVASSQAADPEAVAAPADSLNLEYVGHTGGEVNSVTLQGNYAYVGEGPNLAILDISMPGSVALVSRSFLFPSWVGGIVVSGGLAYIANGESGLRILNVSDPAAPIEVSSIDTQTPAAGVALMGNYAYVVDLTDVLLGGGLRVIDVTVPGDPVEVGFLDTEFTADVALSGTYAYVVRGMYRSMLVVDISDPSNPVEVGSYDPSALSTSIAIVGDYAYLATSGSGMRILDISDPTDPTEIGSFTSSGSVRDIAVQGSFAFLAEDNVPSGLRIVDVSDPTNPTEAGFHTMPAWASGVGVSGNYAYVAAGTSGLRVVDVSDPSSLTETDFYDIPNWVAGVSVVGDYAYLTSPSDDMPIIQVITPTLPLQVGLFDTETTIRDVAVQGNYAYVGADGVSPGLHVVDVSDPANPSEVGYLATTSGTSGVAVEGNYAYLASGDLRVVDITDPTAPIEVGFLAVSMNDVTVFGGFAYLARYPFDGIGIVDVSDPTQPVDVGDLGAYSLSAPVVVGGFAYVASGGAGLSVVDVTDPVSPTVVGTYDTPGDAVDLAVEDIYAYIADGQSGLRMIDISDPANPVEIAYFDTPDNASGVSAVSGTIYVADQMAGLIILQPASAPITTTTTILSDIPDPSQAGQPFTVTFGVTSTLGTPTGVVTVTVSDSAELCSGELVDGAGSCQMALSSSGTYTLTASYAGEGDFLPSSASELHSVEMRRVHLPLLLQNHFLCTDFFDDFNDPSSGWYTGEDSEGRAEYLNGEYSVLLKPANYYWALGAPACDQVNYTVEVDARWAGDSGASYGLIFGIQGDYEQFYSFDVNTDYQDFALYLYGPGGWTEIAPITYSSAIHPGAETNHLKATRSGDASTLEVNGTVLGTWTDSTVSGESGSGLIVSTYSDAEDGEASFDNFAMTGLGSTASAQEVGFESQQLPLPSYKANEGLAHQGLYRQRSRRY